MEEWLLAAAGEASRSALETPRPATLKPVAEFALAAVLLHERRRNDAWTAALLERIAAACASPRLAHLLLTDSRTATTHAWICEALLLLGERPPLAVEILAGRIAELARAPVRGFPLARMEALYVRRRLERAAGCRWPAVGADFRFSWPQGWQPRAAADIYHLTHACLYLSDFGQRDWPDGRAALADFEPALAGALTISEEPCRRAGQLDLLAEIALARLSFSGSADVRPILSTLSRAQASDGAVAGWRGADTAEARRHGTLLAYLATRFHADFRAAGPAVGHGVAQSRW